MIKRASVLTSALLFALTASAQTTTPATTPTPPATSTATPASAPADPPMPKDPNALMQLAARVNGLGSPDMKPWHLKANYQTFDADGKPKEHGVFEEWWAAPNKYKISYISPRFNQVQYHNGEETWTTGDKGWVPFREGLAEEYFVHPLRVAPDLQKLHYTVADRKLGSALLACASFDSSLVADRTDSVETACFDNQKPVLRLEQLAQNIFVLFNEVVRINNQYVDKQILVEDSTQPILKAEVTTLEFPNVLDPSLVLPSSAISDERPTVASGVMAGERIGGQDIKYPVIARQKRVQGTVMLAAIIGKSGNIADLEIISGPRELRESSAGAVKTWKYKPYLLKGQPVEVRTVINVDFTLGAIPGR